jgi:hypothetical protein
MLLYRQLQPYDFLKTEFYQRHLNAITTVPSEMFEAVIIFLLIHGDPSLALRDDRTLWGSKRGKKWRFVLQLPHDEFLTNRHFFPLHIPRFVCHPEFRKTGACGGL